MSEKAEREKPKGRYIIRQAKFENFLPTAGIWWQGKTLQGALRALRRRVHREKRAPDRPADYWLALYDEAADFDSEKHLLTVLPNGTDKGRLA